MKRKTVLLALLGAAIAAPASVAAMPPAEAWEIGPRVRGRNYSVGMPPSPTPVGGGLAFEFPVAGRGQIDALTTAVGPLAGARQITVRYRVDAAPGTRFIADESSEPATASLYFQRRGDNWSGRGPFANYRWYVPARGVIPLRPGVQTVTIRFDEVWTNVNGQPDPQGYAAALADTGRIGLAFGSGSLRSHGVYATGPARFTLLSFDIQ